MIGPESRYEQYWAYLRHVEALRFQLGSIVSVASGAVLGWVVTARGGLHGRALGLGEALKAHAPLGWGVLLLGLFVAAAGFFLLSHKMNYDRYYERLADLDNRLERRGREAFGWLLLMLTVVQVGVALVLCAWGGWHRWLLTVPGVIILYWWVCWGVYWCEERCRKSGEESRGSAGWLCGLIVMLGMVLLWRWHGRKPVSPAQP